MKNKIAIIPFVDHLAAHFAVLNKAWLNKYFEVEALDEKMLGNPKLHYIDKGGFIFFAI